MCADVCTGVSGYAWVYMDVCMGVCGYMEVYPGILGCTWVYAGVRVFVDMHGCMHVCGMNFQNSFWRIESLHQYPIRIFKAVQSLNYFEF